MKNYLSYLRFDKKLFSQYLLVFTAFFMMVLISSYFGGKIVSKNIESYGEEVIASSTETIKATLKEYSNTLDDIGFFLEKLKQTEDDPKVFEKEIKVWSEWIVSKGTFLEFAGVYGVIDGIYIDGSGWVPDKDYVPSERPWYVKAAEMSGGVSFTELYLDAKTGGYCFTASKVLYTKDKTPFGIIAIDLYISAISTHINNMDLMSAGYGVLLDGEMNIIVTPNENFIGVKLGNVKDGIGGYKEMSDMLVEGKTVCAYTFTSYNGTKSVGFFEKLSEGWYIGIVSPSDVYYKDIETMQIVLSITGFIMMVLLCVMLTFMHIARLRFEESSKIKSSILTNMSYKIKPPMNTIVTISELLLVETLSRKQTRYVKDINLSAHSLLTIINNILSMLKIESNEIKLNLVNYNFFDFLENINSKLSLMANDKGLDFQLEKSEKLPEFLFGDDVCLNQILFNICENAIKFTKEGYVSLKVSGELDQIIFKITDTGIGIPKEELNNIFKEQGQREGVSLIGLGLSISKTFTEMMGGNIYIESNKNSGTTFIITIPIVIGKPENSKNIDFFSDNDDSPCDYDKTNFLNAAPLEAEMSLNIYEGVNNTNLKIPKGYNNTEIMTKLLDISEIDKAAGLSRVSGIENMYIETLELFTNKINDQYDTLSKKLEKGDMKSFLLITHAITLGLLAVGAIKLSEETLELEKAAKDEDIDFCRKNFPPLKIKLTELYKKLNSLFYEDE